MSDHQTCTDIPSATSSPESADGVSPFDWLGGPMTAPCGPAPALASLSARQAVEAGLMTKDTYGPPSDGSLTSAALQQSLASRLQARLGGNGSPEYKLTCKQWDMPPLAPIYALRASAHRTSGNGCGGWVTPSVRDWKDTPGMSMTGTNPDGSLRTRVDQLPRQAAIAGWPTPVSNPDNKTPEAHLRMKQRMGERDGSGANRKSITDLQVLAKTFRPGGAPSGSTAPTEKRGALNPALARWLMGYPVQWCVSAIRADRKMKRR